MARDIVSITTLTAQLRFTSPAHIGSAAPLVGEAAPLLRDTAGRPIVPGTSLAGVLRAALAGCGVDARVWGSADTDNGAASRMVVHDAVIALADQEAGARRDGVGIDRATGGAADGRLYAREVIPAGSTFRLRLDVHSGPGDEAADRALLATVDALLRPTEPTAQPPVTTGRLQVGARTSRGLGQLELVSPVVTVTEQRFDTAAEFWKTRREPNSVSLRPVELPCDDVISVDVTWQPATPVIVAAGETGSSLPQLPIAEADQKDSAQLRLIVPGTAIAGALRARAELICRTLTGLPTPDGFDAQLASTPLVTALFGGPAGERGATASPLLVDDCRSSTTIARSKWQTLLSPARRSRSIKASNGAQILITDHVSVDRWTGGAADGRLFAVAEPHGFTYGKIRLRLDRGRLPAAHRDAATALLLITLREFTEGRVPLGGGTHRGLGAVTVSRIVVRGGGLDIDAPTLGPGAFAEVRAAWTAWIDETRAA